MILTFFMAVLTTSLSHASSETDLSRRVDRWLNSEAHAGTKPEYQKRVLWSDKTGFGRKTPYSVLIIHGLYNSPKHMMALTPVFQERHMNIAMTRLKGHWESDRSALTETVSWQDWMSQAEEDFALAQELGDRVILVGHSTGGLLSTWLQLKHPEKVAALILFAPAFEIHPIAASIAWLGDITSIHPVIGGRLLAGHAGLEVIAATQAFQQWVNERGDGFLAQQLKNTPVWMGNTELDVIISLDKAYDFLTTLKAENPAARPRVEWLVPASSLVSHDSLASETNPDLGQILSSLCEFLSSFLDTLGERPSR
jgi:pimeloyl-ACP methyl ester carboxylesterase